MARVTYEEAQQITNSGDFSFFSLKNKETKKVRFLYNSVNEIELLSTHAVVMNDGKTRSVDCLRAVNEPVQNCPLCAMGNRPKARAYISLLGEDGQIYIWERSSKYLETLMPYFDRYTQKGTCPLVDVVFEIERIGEPGSKDTKYNIYYVETNPITDKSTLPERPEILGTLVITKTFEECSVFVNTGAFPQEAQPQLTPRPTTYQNQPNAQPTYVNNPQAVSTPQPVNTAPTQPTQANNTWGNPNGGRRGW